jgi:hypothetical protein
MSEEFIGGLQRDLVEAMARHERRGPYRRAAAALAPAVPQRATLARALAAAAIVVAVAAGLRDLTPAPRPAQPRVVAVIQIGGTPMDAVYAAGSLWVSDFTGAVLQLDPGTHRLAGRVDVPGSPESIAADPRSVWVQTAAGECRGELIRIDPESRRIVAHTPLPYPSEGEGQGALAADSSGVWVKHGCTWGGGVDRVSPAGRLTARVTVPGVNSVDGLAAAGGSVWALGHDGTVREVDAATGRVRRRWPQLAPLSLSDSTSMNTNALVADGTGAWALSTLRQAIFRIQHGRVTRRIPIDPLARPLLAVAAGALWITSVDRMGSDYRLIRIDPDTGRSTATLDLGPQPPVAVVAADGNIYVVTANGRTLVIGS